MQTKKVVDLDQWRNRDSAELLRQLQTQLDQGNLRGLVVQWMDGAGREHPLFTGTYLNDPATAALAGLRLSVQLTTLHDGFK